MATLDEEFDALPDAPAAKALNDEFDALPDAPVPTPVPAAPRAKTPFMTAVGRSVAEAVPFVPQLAGVSEQGLVEARKDYPFWTAATRFGTTLGEYAGAARLGGLAGMGGIAALQEASDLQREGKLDFSDPMTYAKITGSGVLGAAIPKVFKGADKWAKSLAPKAAAPALEAGLQRVKQAVIRTAPATALAVPQAQTFMSPETDTSGKIEAAANLLMLGSVPVLEGRRGLARIGAERAGSIAEQAEMEAQRAIGEKEAARGRKAVEQVRTGEAKAEVARAKAAEAAIAEARKAETSAYEEAVGREVGREVQTAKARSEKARLLRTTQEEEAVRQERRAQQDVLEQQVEQVQEVARQAKTRAEDEALNFAQQRNDITTENRIWEQKNRRAQRAVKDEQRVMSAADRLAKGDQAAITELQNDIARLKRAEDAIVAGDDPSLRGAIAKEYQDMRHRLETALGFFRDGGVEPPPEYLQAYDAVRESYLRNTESQGYTGFGTPDELFLEDPRAWAERKKQRMLQKTEVERTGKEADLVDFLDNIATRDYMAEARATRAGPKVLNARLQEIFADQGLEYDGGPLVGPDGVPLKQAFVGGRVPTSQFTSTEAAQESIARRRELRTAQEEAARLTRLLRRAQPRVSSVSERQRAAQIANIEAQEAAGFSGLTPRQEIEQAVRARTPAATGMSEADILSRAGVSPTPAAPFTEADILQAANITPAEAARLLAEQRAAARANVEFGTQTPTPQTQRQLDLSSKGRALYETAFPEAIRPDILLRGAVGRLRGSNVVPRTLPEYTARTSPTMSTEARMRTPFEALELAGAFERLLRADTAVDSFYRKFVERNPGATWLSFLRANPVVAAKVEAERATAANP